jgi:pimeloyl-ACP methyl ester carboxylesterase
MFRLVVAGLALAAIGLGWLKLHEATTGLIVDATTVGTTPVTVFRQSSTKPSPVIVIAHGFAGSQQLMQPFAATLARNGYIAVTFDFFGHGRNQTPIRGDVTEGTVITNTLLSELGDVIAFARKLPGSDGRLGLLGHSMASDIVVRFAIAHPEIEATTAVSVFSPVAPAELPHNLLVIVGSAEPSMLINEGLRIVNLAAGGNAVERRTYGSFADGTARRLVLARGVEHIGVLYSQDSMRETLNWMNTAFGRTENGYIDQRGIWLGLLFAGLIALAWPISGLLPVVSPTPAGAGLTWMPLLLCAFLPAVLTPLILWKMPTDFLPILLGDYLTLHFALYGALTAVGLFSVRRWTRQHDPKRISTAWPLTFLAAALIAAYNIVAFGLTLDSYVFSFFPIPSRVPLIAAIAFGTIPYFLMDEWLTRGNGARRGSYALTKVFFLLSLAVAVALNLAKLFFLAIIVPAILLLFLAFGLISSWSYRRTRHPLPGALANAALFAWAIAVTFPMVIR